MLSVTVFSVVRVPLFPPVLSTMHNMQDVLYRAAGCSVVPPVRELNFLEVGRLPSKCRGGGRTVEI